MRARALVLIFVASPALALEQTQIQAACYTDCEKETHSSPEYKAWLARAADTADALLNDECQTLQQGVNAAAKEMDVKPDAQLGMLKDAQRQWIEFRDKNCDFEDGIAFGATATGGYASSCICALSYERTNDFDRIRHSVLGQ
ncbi:MAG: lysozyme inhibitor LprI family protein [Methyloceanibacter sp.]